jgi:hypothetical protein
MVPSKNNWDSAVLCCVSFDMRQQIHRDAHNRSLEIYYLKNEEKYLCEHTIMLFAASSVVGTRCSTKWTIPMNYNNLQRRSLTTTVVRTPMFATTTSSGTYLHHRWSKHHAQQLPGTTTNAVIQCRTMAFQKPFVRI